MIPLVIPYKPFPLNECFCHFLPPKNKTLTRNNTLPLVNKNKPND